MAKMDQERGEPGSPGTAPQSLPAPTTMPGTFRLQFDLEGDAADRLRRSPWLARYADKRPVTRRRVIIVFDTPDWILGRAGVALGTLQIGKRRSQILRDIRRPPAGGPVPRRWDGPLAIPANPAVSPADGALPAAALDLTRLAFTPADAAIIDHLTSADLRPVFAAEITRTTWTLDWSGAQLTLAIDLGTIEAAPGKQPIATVDLTIENGDPRLLFDCATALTREAALRLSDRGIEQLGYILASGEDWWAIDPSKLSLTGAVSVRDGFLAIGRASAAALGRLAAALSVDPTSEGIHQTRVVLRRLRSILSIFGPALPPTARRETARALAAVASGLGEAREWDVFAAETLAPLGDALVGETTGGGTTGTETTLRQLRLAVAVLREQAGRAAIAGLSGAEFPALRLHLAAWFEAGLWPETPLPEASELLARPLLDFARDVLSARHKRLLRKGNTLAQPTALELHALRIEAKKLRYAVETFRSLFPTRPARRYLATLRELQDVLGRLNDGYIARGLIGRLMPPGSDGAARAAGLIAGWTAAEMGTAQGRFAAAWRDFGKADRFWKAR